MIEIARESILISHAGLPAERLAHPQAPDAHGQDDENNVDEVCDDLNARFDLKSLRRKAKGLVHENKNEIQKLALAICDRLATVPDELTISSYEINKILADRGLR